VAQQQQEAATKALQEKLTAMLQKNQNFSTGQNNMLNQAQAVAQQRMASRQIPQPYNTAAPYNFAQDRAYTNPTQNLQKLPTGFDKNDVVAPPTSGRPIPPSIVTPSPPDYGDIRIPEYGQDYYGGPGGGGGGGRGPGNDSRGPGGPDASRPSPLVFPTAPPTTVAPPNTLDRNMPITGRPVEPPATVAPPPTPVEPPPPPPVTPPPVTPPPVTPPTPVEPVPGHRRDPEDSDMEGISLNARARKMYDLGNRFENQRSNDRQYLMAMMAKGGLASLPQTNYYKTPDLLQPVSQQPQSTQPVMQPFTRQRVQAVIPNAWDKKAPEPQTHVDPVILDTVTKLSQGITPLEGQNRGGGQGGVAPAPGSGAAQFGGSGFTGASDSGPSTGAASMANKAAAVLGNLGLTSISNGLAANVGTNYGNEGRNSVAPSSAGPTGPDGGPTGSRASASEGGWGGEGRGASGGNGGGGGAATGGSGGNASGGGDRGTRGGFSAGGYISPKSKKKKR